MSQLQKTPNQTSNENQLAERRALVSRLRVQGLSLRAIAQNVGVSVATVSKDLDKAREFWRENAALHYEEHVASTLEELEALKIEAYNAFMRSIGENVTVTETKRFKGKTGEKTVTTRTDTSSGDPRYLTIVQNCIEQRLRLVGSMKGENASGRTLQEFLAGARGRLNATFTRETVELQSTDET